MSDHLDDLYRDILMEHYRFPRGKHPLAHEDIHNEGQNPSCGDEIELALELDGEKVKNVYVSCMGCAISVASGSMLAEVTKGKTLEEIKKIAATIKAMLDRRGPPQGCRSGRSGSIGGREEIPGPGEMRALVMDDIDQCPGSARKRKRGNHHDYRMTVTVDRCVGPRVRCL